MLSSSPQRHTFQKESYIKNLEERSKSLEHEEVKDMLDYFQKVIDDKKSLEETEDWKKNNMEYDLRTTDWILEKARNSEAYSQNLYAAMCNNDFEKIDNGVKWGCSWRYAGGIVADMRQEGDYIDWYCSGIRGEPLSQEDLSKMSQEAKERYFNVYEKYVGESVVTEEIENDLKKLGWKVIGENHE